nr:hypothetical protein [Tanacetum cinerariifolium]
MGVHTTQVQTSEIENMAAILAHEGSPSGMRWEAQLSRTVPVTPIAHSSPEGELALAHKECAVKWFSDGGNMICEICNHEVMNLHVMHSLTFSNTNVSTTTTIAKDCSGSKPIGIAKDVSVKVGVFHFPANFVVVDFEPDPPSLLNSRESQEVLGFFDVTASGNHTPYDDPIISTMSPTLTSFRDSDFLLFEEADAFLGLEDDPNSPKINPFYYDPKGDTLLVEAILNSEPLPPLPNHEQYPPSFKKEFKVCEAETVKCFIDKHPKVELKDLPYHLEYAFLEGDNKLPVIIAKESGDEEKYALIKVLKSHKRAIAWKLSDI